MHTIRCFPPSPSIRLVPMPSSGNAQKAYASGSAVSSVFPIARPNALHIQAAAHTAIVADYGDGSSGYLEVEEGTTIVEFGSNVRSLSITSSASGILSIVQVQTFDNPGGTR